MDFQNPQFQVIDLSKLKEYFGEDKDTLTDFLNLFLSQSKEEIEILSEQINKRNFNEISKQAHKLKSTYASMGIIKAAELLSEIDYSARENGGYEKILKCFDEFMEIQKVAESESKIIIG